MRDAEVRDASIVKRIPFRGPLKCFLIVEDAFLECLDLFRKVAILNCGIGFTVGDGCEESIRNGAKELSVDVGIGIEGGLSRPWQHCWCSRSHWSGDWEQN